MDPNLEQSSDARTFAMLCHLSGLFVGFLGPLIIWLIKRDEHPFVDDQGKEALNFQITVLLALVASAILVIMLIGLLLLPIVGVAALILSIIGAIEANKGAAYRYPVNIRLIK